MSVDGGKTVLAVFHESARLILDDGGFIEPDIPCVIILAQLAHGYRLVVADPTHRAETALIQTSTAEKREIRIELPQGQRAGSTTVVSF